MIDMGFPENPNSPYDPHWTEREFSAGGSRDDLGIETLGQAILSDLLPGVNNQTRRARYYSFWAWVLRDFINDRDTKHTQSSLYEWLRRRESALILANLSHDCGGGAAGSTIGGRVWQGGEKETYPLGWKSLESVSGGGYQLYYRGGLQETNIIVSDDESPHDSLTESVGLRLADAYEHAIAGCRYARDYLDATTVRKTDLEDFADVGCLCQASIDEQERKLLIDTLFRFDTPDVFAVKRLTSLSLFLDIIDQSDAQPLDEASFRAALYFWGFGDHHAYKPQGNLLEAAQRWRVFQLRQYFVFAIESFWSLFLHRIQIEPLSEEEYIDWLLEDLDLSPLAEEFDLSLPTGDFRSAPLGGIFEAIHNALPKDALAPGHSPQSVRLNERNLTNQLRHERSRTDVRVHVGDALFMLGLMYWRSSSWRKLPGYHYVSEPFAAGRLPFENFVRHVDRAFQEEWSLGSWLLWFHRRYLWLQHRRVTLEKLVSRSQETSKFELLYEEGFSVARYKGLGVDEPKMNAPRFPSALLIFLDLDLIERIGNGYRMRPDGKRLLDQFRDYRVPAWEESEEEYEAAFDLEELSS
jgi:hypothetical protein